VAAVFDDCRRLLARRKVDKVSAGADCALFWLNFVLIWRGRQPEYERGAERGGYQAALP